MITTVVKTLITAAAEFTARLASSYCTLAATRPKELGRVRVQCAAVHIYDTLIKQADSFGSDWSLTFDFRPVIENPVLKWFQ